MEVHNPLNELESVQARKDQEDPWVMYLIVRASLEMGTGKIGAQVGHAVAMMYEHYFTGAYVLSKAVDPFSFFHWRKDSFRKVVLRANEKKWEKIKENLECFVVRDAGLTEVDPGSETVIGIWPMKKSEQPRLLKKLQALK